MTKTIFKNSFDMVSSLSFGKNKSKREEKTSPAKRAGMVVLVLFIFGSLFFSMFTTGYSIFSIAAIGGFMEAALTVVIPVLFVLVFMFTLTLVVSIFFLSNDTNVFLPLPIKPEEIFFARLLVASINAFLLEAVFVIPFLASYDAVVQPGFLVYLNELIFVIILPFIPLSITFLAAILLGRIFHVNKHKEAFTMVMMLFSVATILAMELGLSSVNTGMGNLETEAQYIQRMGETFANMADRFSFLDPVLSLPRSGLLDQTLNGSLGMLAFAGVSAGLVLLSSLIAKGFYLKTLIGNEEHHASRHSSADVNKALQSEAKNAKPYQNCLKNEWRTIIRNPNYVFNLLTPPILVIVIFGFTIYGTVSGSGEGSTITLPAIAAVIKGAFTFSSGSIIFFAGAVTMFIASMTMISSTAISREGKNAFLLKTWPVKPITQLRAKISIGTAMTSLLLLIFIVAIAIIGRLNPLIPIMIFVPTVILLIVANYWLILVDLAHPFLDWENDVAAVKQSKSAIWGMLICLAFALILVFCGLGAAAIGLDMIWSSLLLLVVASGSFYLTEQGIKKKGSRIYRGIQ